MDSFYIIFLVRYKNNVLQVREVKKRFGNVKNHKWRQYVH